ncbi:hypothetical protein [Prochlorococcus sp. MIT 0801]|uniref:hypothetical protein n=1 Tax=Prochlorococcus sp. MIT 0801 TaxID=1501269 RepID=UPI0004F6D139|nr:hypothetical protein [Prochlorococcus sp. MIT 0801]AIQ96201.1 hypothetical protein EW15_0109 [Prochlorococcus sp. MIT 0801]
MTKFSTQINNLYQSIQIIEVGRIYAIYTRKKNQFLINLYWCNAVNDVRLNFDNFVETIDFQ